MTNVTQLNQIKNSAVMELLDKLDEAIANTDDLTPVEIVGCLEMVKAKYAMIPYLETLE